MNIESKKLWLFALDPVHVGAGTAHLSHVDLEIVRDQPDRLPKIPASTIAGNARSNADRMYYQGKPNKSCAGLGKAASQAELEKNPDLCKTHCGKCPICHAFGTLDKDEPSRRALTFQDALLLLFPVYSYTHGPVWITARSGLDRFGQAVTLQPDQKEDFKVWSALGADRAMALGRRIANQLGTLTVDADQTSVAPLKTILEHKKIVAVTDQLFSKLVNENLEVRTSVAINPFTGTAEKGALYRYEALPRASLLLGSVGIATTGWSHVEEKGWESPEQTLKHGLDPLAITGLGRMGSRGFGRMQYVLEEV